MRDVSILIWSLLAASVVVCECLAVYRPHQVATIGDACARLMAPVALRVVVLLGWAWVGWHFFVR
jgi:hypothetical protein